MDTTSRANGNEPLPNPADHSYHGAVCAFKRRLIEATLHQVRGNRTHAARALGLQRTYLLRLIRDLGVAAPPPPPRRGRASGVPIAS
ncbi:MAG: helix-turn-helix domain-containing protein [Candidatus Rokuibacteriota bacterium]